jgi:hypothetical protein
LMGKTGRGVAAPVLYLPECVERWFSEVRMFACAGIAAFAPSLLGLVKDGAFGGYAGGGFVTIVAYTPRDARTKRGTRCPSSS